MSAHLLLYLLTACCNDAGSKAYNDAHSAARDAIGLRYGLSVLDDDSMHCAIMRLDCRISQLGKGQAWLEQHRDVVGFDWLGDLGSS